MFPSGTVRCPVPSVEVYIAGSGYGEGLLVIIGGHLVFGVDCCAELSARVGRVGSYVYQKLRSLDSTPRLYWILTHYHHNHFQGLRGVLEECGQWLEGVLVPLSYTKADAEYEMLVEAETAKLCRAEKFIAKGEYRRLRAALTAPAVRPRTGSLTGTQEFTVRLRPRRRGKEEHLRLSVLGPDHVRAGREQARSFRRIGGQRAKSTDRDNANRTSYVITMELARTALILLGDCPVEEVLGRTDFKGGVAERIFLKVSHHGSETGTNQELLAKLISDRRSAKQIRIAAVTPYRSKGLPEESVLTMLKGEGFDVLETNACKGHEELDDISAGRLEREWRQFGPARVRKSWKRGSRVCTIALCDWLAG